MTLRTRTSFLRAGAAAALLLALVVVAHPRRAIAGRTNVASEGAVGRPFSNETPDDRVRAAARRRLAERAADTYIGEMLAAHDSSLARWPDRDGEPLTVWVQPATDIEGWTESYLEDVQSAFDEWNAVRIPLRFSFTTDSAAADVHVTFVDHFDEEISGRTKWARDDQWWITDANIVLAVYHRDGPMLDDDAMHAMTLHEIGHLLGLDHTRDSSSIMAPRVRVRSLSRADRATLRLLYTLPAGAMR